MAEKSRQRDPAIKNDVAGVKAVDWLLAHSQKQTSLSGLKEMHSVCVCVRTHMGCMHIVWVHTHMRAHRDQRAVPMSFSSVSLHLMSLSLKLEFIYSAGSGWMVTSRVHLSPVPSTGVTDVHPAQSSHGCYGAELPSSCLHSRHFAG